MMRMIVMDQMTAMAMILKTEEDEEEVAMIRTTVIKFIQTIVILMVQIAIVHLEIDTTVIVSVMDQVVKMNIYMRMILIKLKMKQVKHCWRKHLNLLSKMALLMISLMEVRLSLMKVWEEQQNQGRKRKKRKRSIYHHPE